MKPADAPVWSQHAVPAGTVTTYDYRLNLWTLVRMFFDRRLRVRLELKTVVDPTTYQISNYIEFGELVTCRKK